MGARELVTFGSALAGDVLSVFSIPGGNTLASVAGAFMERRAAVGRDVLIAQIADAKIQFEEAEVDPLISVLLRFSKAVEDGAAKQNIELMAKVIVGLKRNKALAGDTFNRWASILANLTRDEILAIGAAYKISTTRSEFASPNTEEPRFWRLFVDFMSGSGYSLQEIASISASISRYGLFLPQLTWNGVIYEPSPWLIEVAELADLPSGSREPTPR